MDLFDFRVRTLREYVSVEVYAEICRHARRQKFADGALLQMRGDNSPRLCIIAAGAVRIGRVRPDGSFNLVSMLGVGSHFGDVGLQRATNTHDSYAHGDCEIFIIEDSMLESLLSSQPGFALGLWRCSTARLEALLELYDDVRTLSVEVRLAKVIFLHAGRGDLVDGIQCRQRDFADLLGVTEVSIGVALKALGKAGLIEKGYRSVRITDKRKLGSWLKMNNAM